MRIMRWIESSVALIAVSCALAAIGLALFGVPDTGPFDAFTGGRAEAEVSAEPGSRRAHLRGIDDAATRVEESTTSRVECRFEDGTLLASGVVLLDGEPVGAIDAEGTVSLPIEPTSRSRVEVETSPLARVEARFVERRIVVPCGFFVTARVCGVDRGKTRFAIERGRIDARDRVDFLSERGDGSGAETPESLRTFECVDRGEIDGDGFGPNFVPRESDDDRFSISFHRGRGAVTVAIPPGVVNGTIVDLGRVEPRPAGSLTIVVEHAGDLDLEISLCRIQERGSKAPADHLLALFAPASFDALRAGLELDIDEHAPEITLSPLDDGEVAIVLKRTDGPRLDPVLATVSRDHETTVILDAAPLARIATRPVSLRFAPDAAVVAGARVTLTDETRTVTVSGVTDEGGIWRVPDPGSCGLKASAIVVVEGFDPARADRIHRAALPEPNLDGGYQLVIPRLKALEVVGSSAPPLAPRDRPLAYSVEVARPGESFVPYPVEEFVIDADSVTAFITDWDAMFRLVAHYSATYAHASVPVAVLESDARVETVFAAPDRPPEYLTGRLVGADGVGIANASIEATTGSGLPPESVRTDESGRFVLGPVLAHEIEILANGASWSVRAPFREEAVLMSR